MQYEILVETKNISFSKHGHSPFTQTDPAKRYLTMSSRQNFKGGCPESGPLGVSGTKTTTIDVKTGIPKTTGDSFVNTGGSNVESPFRRSGTSNLSSYDDPPNEKADCSGTLRFSTILSGENTTKNMVIHGKDKLEGFNNTFVSGTPFAYRNVHKNELKFDYQKTQFKFKWKSGITPEQRHSLIYLLLFRPENDPSTLINESEENAEVIKTITWNGQSTESPPFTIDPDSERNEKDGSYTILPVEVVPDEGQMGVTGDQIPSNKGVTGQKHYVSPKKSVEIPNDFVVLQAKGIEKKLFEKVLEWEAGETFPNEPLKRRVKRDATGKTAVKLKIKDGGQEVDLMNVWVVWSEITTVNDGVAGKGFYSRQEDDTGERYWVVPNPANMRKFKCTIAPAEIVTAKDHPALGGAKQKPVPGSNQISPIDPQKKADSATNKWDMSRQLEVTLANPGGILRGDLQPTLPASFCVNQPNQAGDPIIVLDKVIPFPQEAGEGNDDPLVADEDTNPYEARNLGGQQAGLNHEIGEITSVDAPNLPVQDNWGINERQFGIRFNFNEFARLELWNGNRDGGMYWFRISDHFKWHHLIRAKFSDSLGKWINFGSSAGIGHK